MSLHSLLLWNHLFFVDEYSLTDGKHTSPKKRSFEEYRGISDRIADLQETNNAYHNIILSYDVGTFNSKVNQRNIKF